MCGILGYISQSDAASLLLCRLLRLGEYRGYDSAGIAVLINGVLSVVKQKGGNAASLDVAMAGSNGAVSNASGHRPYPVGTHSDPSDRNPHMNVEEDIGLIHNGIIENHTALRVELAKNGYSFASDADFEVLVHLIDHLWINIPFLDFELEEIEKGGYEHFMLEGDF